MSDMTNEENLEINKRSLASILLPLLVMALVGAAVFTDSLNGIGDKIRAMKLSHASKSVIESLQEFSAGAYETAAVSCHDLDQANLEATPKGGVCKAVTSVPGARFQFWIEKGYPELEIVGVSQSDCAGLKDGLAIYQPHLLYENLNGKCSIQVSARAS